MAIQQTSFVPPPPTSPSSAPPVDSEADVSAALLAGAALNSPKRLTPSSKMLEGGGVDVGDGLPPQPSLTAAAGALSPQTSTTSEASESLLSPTESALKKRAYILRELVETERDYVADLAAICRDYIPNMKEDSLPEGLQGKKDKVIFGNVQSIYEFHRDRLLPDLEKCVAGFSNAPDDKEAGGEQQQQQQQQQQSLNLQLVFCGPKGERQKKLEYIYRYVLRAGNNR